MRSELFHSLPAYLSKPEKDCVAELMAALKWDEAMAERIGREAADTIAAMREAKRRPGGVENFFQAYSLSTQEGIALMCLAEALLRIPDSATANALIRDKVSGTEWVKAAASNDDWILRMAGMGLSATRSTLDGPLSRLGEPVIRKALSEGMKVLGGQFVAGQSMKEALKNASKIAAEKGYLFSFDMLGEGARTMGDADAYYAAYVQAIEEIAARPQREAGKQSGVSVKLSALYPRYSFSQESHCVPILSRKLGELCRKAAAANICLTVDAEESERLQTSLKIIRSVIEDVSLNGWSGFGLAMQAYDKRALTLVRDLIDLSRQTGRRFQIRLVKGAYWDSEIKKAQVKGLADYPVYTRKVYTDLSYLACAQELLRARALVYPMFGTHNAYTVRAVLNMAGEDKSGFEFQRLFGMGDTLYDYITHEINIPVRIYAPVGVHKDLLPYLVRRLLENGANSSFVNKVFDPSVPAKKLAQDPVEAARETGGAPHPSIPLPCSIFPGRKNSEGLDLDDAMTLRRTKQAMEQAFERREVFAGSIVNGRMERTGVITDIKNPADFAERIGTSYSANEALVEAAFTSAYLGYADWNDTLAAQRAEILNRIADLYEENRAMLMALCTKEAGKTLADGLAEVREAVDFCRYYAALGVKDFDENGRNLPSYTGESNKILLQGRGVFVCISPWNFPLAIFTGQIVAALMAGNSVVAKPAEQTPFIAQAAVELMHKAGVPHNVLHLLIGDGRVGEMIVQHKHAAGVAFTGSTGAAFAINRMLAAKDGPIATLIAETGGQNVMIADSSALPEQVVDDVILSAFGSSGQRCSACRVLFVQQEIADKVITMLRGAMAELTIGDPQFYETDIGPLIDEEALANLQYHKSALEGIGKFIAETRMPEQYRRQGHYFAPIAYEISDISELRQEVFGPALHVIRYRAEQLPQVIKSINESGYGLTFGFHTRINTVAQDAIRRVGAGNIYINRSTIGAVVGVQPFGGRGLSGTGPKAGGPYYLHRFATEKTVSVNTAAVGGNASLVMLEE